ncbi:MAG TPA: NAD-glutamate dehydrogenase, partial [Gammaproteobacteria bacterium]
MSAQLSDAKERHIEKVITHARKKAGTDDEVLLDNFIRHYYSAVAAEDLIARSPAELYGAAAAHFEYARKRTKGLPSIRIYNPAPRAGGYKSTHTVVEMVNDDMPFLVDSASMALNKHGYAIHLTIHPIFKTLRDKRGRLEKIVAPHEDLIGAQQESFIRFEIDRETEKSDLAALEAELHNHMQDVAAAVADWATMRGKASEIINLLSKQPPKLDPAEITEGIKFLDWLVNNHFTFLGYREYDLVSENGEDVLRAVAESGLGILRNSAEKSQSFMVLPKDIRQRARAKELLIITKANSVSTVHRPSYLDYIGIKRFNEKGEVVGERRFLGL